MIVTLTGENAFGLRQELGSLVSAFVAEHGDMALEKLDGEEASFERIQESLQSVPFLTPHKLVVLREPGKVKAFAENIEAVLKGVAHTTDVIIVELKLDKRVVYYKTLKKKTDFREFGELDAQGLARWAVEYAKTRGGSVSSGDARLLIDRLGPRQQLLQHELDKLLLYAPQITRPTIELLSEPTPQSTIFELIDAAFSGNTKRALELYREQRALKVEPQAIISMLVWQLHILAVLKTAASRPADVIAREAKLSPFVVRKSQALTRRLELARLKEMIAKLLALDVKLKTVTVDADEALQLYLLQLV